MEAEAPLLDVDVNIGIGGGLDLHKYPAIKAYINTGIAFAHRLVRLQALHKPYAN